MVVKVVWELNERVRNQLDKRTGWNLVCGPGEHLGTSEGPSPSQLGHTDGSHGLLEAWHTEGATPAWRTEYEKTGLHGKWLLRSLQVQITP